MRHPPSRGAPGHALLAALPPHDGDPGWAISTAELLSSATGLAAVVFSSAEELAAAISPVWVAGLDSGEAGRAVMTAAAKLTGLAQQ